MLKYSKALFKIILPLLFLFSFIHQALAAQLNDGQNKYVTIPVLYLTDRELKGDTYGSNRRYPIGCKHQMYYGTIFETVSDVKVKGNNFSQLGWQTTNTKPAKIAAKDKIDPLDPVLAKKEFFDRLKKAIAQSGQTDFCIFVHGACDPFEDCASDAAQLAYYLEKPIILYSWPANPKWRDYLVDNSNSEWSQGHFNQFCQDLISFQSQTPCKIICLSHSMGNRLVVRSLPIVYGKGIIKDWELISPDIDTDTCRHYMLGYQPKEEVKIRLYVSNRDKMLPLAQRIAGGYYRLGEAANPADFAQESLNTNIFQRIDFSAIDTGFSGHSIPFQLIANMVHNNAPGSGLALTSEASVKPSLLVRWFNRLQHLDSKSSMEAPAFCKRIVKIDESTK